MSYISIEITYFIKNPNQLIIQQQNKPDNDTLQLNDISIVIEDITKIKQINLRLQKPIIKQDKRLFKYYNKLTKTIKINYELNNHNISQINFPIPEAFIEYLTNYNQIENKINYSKYLNLQTLFACGSTFDDERTQNIVLDHIKDRQNLFEELLQLLQLSYQYKQDIISLKIYELIKLIFFWKLKIVDIKLPLSNKSIEDLKKMTFEQLNQAQFKINNKLYQIHQIQYLTDIAYQSQQLIHQKYYSAISKRQKFYLYISMKESNDQFKNPYPQIFIMKNKENGEEVIIGYQYNSISEILLFSKQCVNYFKYNEYYLGCIQHNIWVTEFILYDNGVDEKYQTKMPFSIYHPKKEMMHLKFDTCITKSQPWHFQITLNNNRTLVTKKPVFLENLRAYHIKFMNPEIKQISTRNFQLIENGRDEVYYEHGKTDNEKHHIDCLGLLNLLEIISISLITLCQKPLVR